MFHLLRFERLESRQMLSATAWMGSSGDWNNTSNWTNGVPAATSTVTINPAAAATITIQPGETDTVQSLALGSNASLSMPGGGDPSNPATNLIANNPGFESPVASNGTTRPSAWGYWGSSFLSRQYAYSGSQSLVVSGNNSGVTQTFTVTPGASYTASVYAMTPPGNRLTGGIVAELQLLYYDLQGNQISAYSAPNQIVVLDSSSATGGPLPGSVGTEGWNHFFTTAIAPSNAATAHVQLATYLGSGSPGGAVYFDGVEFGPAIAGASTLTTGSFSNSGAINVGPMNAVTVNGGFTQTSTGTLDIQLGGAPSTGIFGSLTISGAAILAGTLEAEVVYSYAPSTTDAFTPVTYHSESGSFADYLLPSGKSYQFAGAVSFTNVLLSTAPTAAVNTTVSAATRLHPVATNLMGVNLTWWDTAAVTSQTEQMVTAAGLNTYRFPGGSSSDDFHFNVASNSGDSVAITIPQFVQFITSAGGTGLVTLDYGSGSPEEAAAELAYLEGSTADTTVIGNGIEWNDSTNQWQTVNWGTAGYWASLRAATPLAHDDGLNFLRVGHAAPFTDIKYWEVGNEEYGSWEIDHHGTAGPGGVSTRVQHDPATYVAFAKQFADLAAEITTAAGLPAVLIGIDSGDPTGESDNSWTKNVLSKGLSIGFVPNFISDHSYMQAPGSESDSYLLNDTVTDPSSALDWSTRYGLYQTLLQQTLSSQAASVQIMATEFNSVYSNPGKQSTSLVNGLFIANSLGSLLASGYSGGIVWDLRNGWDTSENNSNLLYGWREGGDYGILGPAGKNDAPYADTYVAYPSYFALQLASKLITAGGQVVPATSNYSDLDVYADMQPGGDLDLLVINTNPAAAITNQFNLTGFQPSGAAQIWQYGKTQDTAQSLTTTGASSLSHTSTTLTLNGASFAYSFPAYSMTLLDLTAAPTLTSISVALASNNLDASGTEQFSATARDQFNNPLASQPAFTWSVVGGGQIDSNGNYMPPYVPGSATIYASSGGVTGSVTVVYPGFAQWSSGTAGSWTSSSWTGSTSGAAISPPGLRTVVGDTALFASAGTTVTLNGANPNLGGMTFKSATSYTIAAGSGGAIQLGNGASPATLAVSSGSDTIAAPLVLKSGVNIVPAAGSTLSISQTVSGSASLTLNGPGTLVLSGANSYSGGTTVLAGTLIVAGSEVLPEGSSLTVGAGGVLKFDPSAAGSPPIDALSANVMDISPVTMSLFSHSFCFTFALRHVILPR